MYLFDMINKYKKASKREKLSWVLSWARELAQDIFKKIQEVEKNN